MGQSPVPEEHTRGEHLPDEYLIGRIREAIASDLRTNEIDVHVRVSGDDIFLRGNASTQERRAAMTQVVKELCPDATVHNEVSVPSFAEPAEADEEVLS